MFLAPTHLRRAVPPLGTPSGEPEGAASYGGHCRPHGKNRWGWSLPRYLRISR
jgi:hypothetical protein